MPHSRNENGTGSVHMMDFMDFVACLAVQRSGRGKGTGDLGGGGGGVSAAKTHILRYAKNQSDISRKTRVFLNDCVHAGRI